MLRINHGRILVKYRQGLVDHGIDLRLLQDLEVGSFRSAIILRLEDLFSQITPMSPVLCATEVLPALAKFFRLKLIKLLEFLQEPIVEVHKFVLGDWIVLELPNCELIEFRFDASLPLIRPVSYFSGCCIIHFLFLHGLLIDSRVAVAAAIAAASRATSLPTWIDWGGT